jgi:hypothetical protein
MHWWFTILEEPRGHCARQLNNPKWTPKRKKIVSLSVATDDAPGLNISNLSLLFCFSGQVRHRFDGGVVKIATRKGV